MKFIVRWQVSVEDDLCLVHHGRLKERDFDTRAGAEGMLDVLVQSAERLGVQFELVPAVTARLDVDLDPSNNP